MVGGIGGIGSSIGQQRLSNDSLPALYFNTFPSKHNFRVNIRDAIVYTDSDKNFRIYTPDTNGLFAYDEAITAEFKIVNIEPFGNNKAINVTGMLLFDSGSFLQILEGEEEQLKKLFKTISNDRRHKNIVKIVFEAIAERKFQEWSMGYASLSKSELSKIDGMNEFFQDSSYLTELDKGRAKKILIAFSAGRWRLN